MRTARICQYILIFLCTSSLLSTSRLHASSDKQKIQQQQPSGIAWALQAIAALTGGNPVSAVTESGTVTRTVGKSQQVGTITLQSVGVMANQISISTGAGNLSETRSWSAGTPSGQWAGLDGQPHPMAQQNCWTDAVWFFPALSLLADYADPTLVFLDLGQQQYSGGSVEHIQVYRYLASLPQDGQQILRQLSTVDYYLNSQTALPVAVAFLVHDEHNINANVPVAIVYSQYQAVDGLQVPYQVTRLLNGSSFLQVSITGVSPSGQ